MAIGFRDRGIRAATGEEKLNGNTCDIPVLKSSEEEETMGSERQAKMAMNTEKTALLIIDVQNGFISDYTRKCLSTVHSAVASQKFPLVVATKFYNAENSPFRKHLNWHRLAEEEDTRLDAIVSENADVIVDKTTYGAVDRLDSIMQSRGLNEVLIMGIDTDVCVLQNAAGLFDLGYKVWVDLSGCATNTGPRGDNAAFDIFRRTIGEDQIITGYSYLD